MKIYSVFLALSISLCLQARLSDAGPTTNVALDEAESLPSPSITTEIPGKEGEVDFSIEVNSTDAENADDEPIYFDNTARRWTGTDILISVFFLIAAGWLILAIYHSSIILFLLRLQARGELDIYDDDFGVFKICSGRITLRLSWMLRRYAVQLEQEQQARQHEQYQSSRGDGNPQQGENREQPRVRIMTRWERRCAIERMLEGYGSSKCGHACPNKASASGPTPASMHHKIENNSFSEADDKEAPVCAICLSEFEGGVYVSPVCSHRFHYPCILDWLERRQNTECPCCRKNLISDDEVWKVVKRMRKERRRQLRKENGIGHRCTRWVLRRVGFRGVVPVEESGTESTLTGDVSDEIPIPSLHRNDTVDIEDGESLGTETEGQS